MSTIKACIMTGFTIKNRQLKKAWREKKTKKRNLYKIKPLVDGVDHMIIAANYLLRSCNVLVQ